MADGPAAGLAIVETLDGLGEGRLRDREGEVVDAAGVGRGAVGAAAALLVGEDRDQPAVGEVGDVRLVEVSVTGDTMAPHEEVDPVRVAARARRLEDRAPRSTLGLTE